MSAPNDGGPAFPLSPEVGKAHFDDPFAYPGMSLRDWFAGQVLAGMWANHDYLCTVKENAKGESSDARLADNCYAMADAMLLARQTMPPSTMQTDGGSEA